MSQEQKLQKRRRERAEQFLAALQDLRSSMRTKAAASRTDNIGYYLLADGLAREFNITMNYETAHTIAGWIRDGDPPIQEIELLMNVVPMFWAVQLSVSSDGQVQTPSKEQIERFSEFIQPDHVYLDVTAATLDDVREVWGERKSIKEITAESKVRIPAGAKLRADYLLEKMADSLRKTPLQRLNDQDYVARELENLKAKPPRNGKDYTRSELEAYYRKLMRRQLQDDPTGMWMPPTENLKTVSQVQDVLEVTNMARLKVDVGRRRGRQKGYETEWDTWRTRSEEIGYDRAQAEYMGRFRFQFLDTPEAEYQKFEKSEMYKSALRNWRRHVKKTTT